MRLSLFSRLTLGYLTIFLIVALASGYAVLQLRDVRNLTEAILKVDTRLLDHEKTLADLLLAQSRAEQKFTITKDEAWYLQFVGLKIDFEGRLQSAIALQDRAATPILQQIANHFRRYEELVSAEARLVRGGKSYDRAQYKQNKDTLIDAMLEAFEKLRMNQRQLTYAKLSELATAADQAAEISGIIAVASLVAIVLMSLFITNSITQPIALLKGKTREIAKGNFEGELDVRSPPEIGELAAAINSMCAKLHELDRLKADFFAYMSHELRTPLTAIKEGTGLLLDGVGGETTEKQRKLLSILAEESNRLINVVSSLLDLSKMEAGMMVYDFETTHVDPLIKRAISEIAPLVEAKRIVLESDVEPTLAPVRADPERILQVLRNLLGNAVKFTPDGGLVRIAAKPDDGKLAISVKDSGPGIAAESLTSIFEKFNQGSRRSPQTRQGTGLGLAIAKNIITTHGGRIWAESELGKGSTFVFVLPC
ncbi:MAG TPA: HAMP domain-containing sensor histidine kinase [Candidatus Binatia bacterium]|nr:HAMP domain-containing sensor histidine kinase [Candidatus Binatia bacterium]